LIRSTEETPPLHIIVVPSGIRLRDRNGRLEPTVSLSKLLEESFQIAWEYLERTGELGDGAVASRFLSDTIEAMIRQGQRSRPSPIVPSAHISVFDYPAQRDPGALVRLTTYSALYI
jgi:hypothetical protein